MSKFVKFESIVTTIGIDLGTTNSLVGYMGENGPVLFKNELGEELIPSCVSITKEGSWIVGRPAKDRFAYSAETSRAFFKRDIGTDFRYKLDGAPKISPTECSALILKELKRVAELNLGESVEHAVITVPAYFHEAQRSATVEAAKIAGLKVKRIVNEPTAAALAFGYENPDEEKHLLIFDLGGGTFDVSVLEVFDGVIEIMASGGESRLGGEDYTDYLLEKIIGQHSKSISKFDKNKLRTKIEWAKMELSEFPSTKVIIDDDSYEISREDFEEWTFPLTKKIANVIQTCLRDARLKHEDIDDVLLVGGASKMVIVQKLLCKEFGRFPNRSLDPDRVVAFGAIIQAALSDRNSIVEDIVLTDVCSHTLGINVSKQVGINHNIEGYFEPIIDRNTMVPTSFVKTFQTIGPQQDRVEVEIYQGEHRMVKDNRLLGKLSVVGLRHRHGEKNGGEITVRFSYDMNALLEVEVTDVKNQKKYKKIIEQRPGSMTEKEIESAIKKFNPLKIHPKDKLQNRAIIERANRIYPDLVGVMRDELDTLLLQFEVALESQKSSEVNLARSMIDKFLEPYLGPADRK